ncbi:hypothetical protein [Polyangium fumosum]|uniref:Uncharacterized protein n=1 Tax=Polyangium fumosum TaxID=889272 RepID=A0A4U1JC63_9BACT|nr:hypothetical protein [Polyangium fumosum]TKD05242.1 hypothetical protein E8A74_20775 [Polyangium fumosum]
MQIARCSGVVVASLLGFQAITGIMGCSEVGGPTTDAVPLEGGHAEASVERALEGTLLIEVGHTSPEMDGFLVRADREVSLELTIEGRSTFADGSTSRSLVAGPGDVVRLPAILAADTVDESFVIGKVDGAEVDRQRIATLPEGGVEELKNSFKEMSGAVLHAGEAFAIVDEDAVASQASAIGSPAGILYAGEDDIIPLGLCVREAWGPGKVVWDFANPQASGYSSKPENAWNLVWASAPQQDTDGIYRSGWGCGQAFKIPDSCTATVAANGTISYCCNWAMQQLGHVCQWVNPGAIGWPNCPL